MGFVTSGTTGIRANAYLTNIGREYFFNKNNIRFDSLGDDLFEIRYFTLGDADVNYRTLEQLEAGEVPDLSGKYTSCLKTAVDYEQKNLLFFQNFDQIVSEDVDYTTDAPNDILNISVNLGGSDDLPIGQDTTSPTGPTGGSAVSSGNNAQIDGNRIPIATNNSGGGAVNANNLNRQ